MRINSYIRIALLGGILLGFSACVKEANYVFDDTAAVRMKDNLESISKVLTSAPHGWYLEYFLNEDLASAGTGGYSLLLKFDGKKVTAWGDLKKSTESASSLYKLTTDNGPVLSFDSYNEVIHYLSTPSGTNENAVGQSGHYQGLGGDFEFLVLKATSDTVLLKGKRGGIEMLMLPLSREPSEVITDIAHVGEDMYVSAFYSDDKALAADFDLTKRHVTFSATRETADGTEKVSLFKVPFLFSDDGIRLQETFGEILELGLELYPESEKELADVLPALRKGMYYNQRNFTWHSAERKLTAQSSTLQGVMPAGWLSYEDLAGDYTLSFDNSDPYKTVDITLEPDVYRQSFKLTGLNPLITLTVEYSLASGNLALMGQTIGEEGNYVVWWSPWSRIGGGSLWCSSSYGMKTELDQESYDADPEHFTLNWVTGPCATGKPIDSFIIYMREGSTSKGAAPARWNIPGTTARLPYLHSITKK